MENISHITSLFFIKEKTNLIVKRNKTNRALYKSNVIFVLQISITSLQHLLIKMI